MSRNNNNKESNSSTDEKRTYGSWSDRRIMVLIDSMINYHPFNRKKLEVAEAKRNVMTSVNEIDSHLKGISSWNTFQNKVDTLIEDVMKKQTNDHVHGSGSNDSETHLENRVMELKQMVSDCSKRYGLHANMLIIDGRRQEVDN